MLKYMIIAAAAAFAAILGPSNPVRAQADICTAPADLVIQLTANPNYSSHRVLTPAELATFNAVAPATDYDVAIFVMAKDGSAAIFAGHDGCIEHVDPIPAAAVPGVMRMLFDDPVNDADPWDGLSNILAEMVAHPFGTIRQH